MLPDTLCGLMQHVTQLFEGFGTGIIPLTGRIHRTDCPERRLSFQYLIADAGVSEDFSPVNECQPDQVARFGIAPSLIGNEEIRLLDG